MGLDCTLRPGVIFDCHCCQHSTHVVGGDFFLVAGKEKGKREEGKGTKKKDKNEDKKEE